MTPEPSSFASRLQELVDEHKSANFAATQWGIPNSLLRKYLAGSVPGLDKALQISDRAKVALQWLATGEGPKRFTDLAEALSDAFEKDTGRSPLKMIPRLDIEPAAGHGSLASSEEDKVGELAFSAAWLRQRGINPHRAHVLTARGDSMEPTIRAGDVLLVDTSIEQIEDNGIYVVRLSGMLLLKRIHVRSRGGLTLISDNTLYRPEEITAEQLADIHVAGRVMWFGRSI